MLEVAGARLHGTTREAPLERFARERSLLAPLPPIAPDLGTWAMAGVHRDGHLQFDKSLYSVPFTLIGRRLWLRATDTSVSIFEEYRLIAQHLRATVPGTRRTVREHLPPEAQAYFLHDRHWCVAQAAKIGPACAELVDRLLADRIVERLRAAQGILQLAQRFEPARVEAACQRALDHDSPYYRTVKTLLVHRPAWLTANSAAPSTEPYVGAARFARPAQTLFQADTPTPAPGPFVLVP